MNVLRRTSKSLLAIGVLVSSLLPLIISSPAYAATPTGCSWKDKKTITCKNATFTSNVFNDDQRVEFVSGNTKLVTTTSNRARATYYETVQSGTTTKQVESGNPVIANNAAVWPKASSTPQSGSSTKPTECKWLNTKTIACSGKTFGEVSDGEFMLGSNRSATSRIFANHTNAANGTYQTYTTQGTVSSWKDSGGVVLADTDAANTPVSGGTTGTGEAGSENEASCDAGAFTWLLCPAITLAQKSIEFLQDKVLDQLEFTLLQNGSNDQIREVWSNFRDVANVFFILIFFVVIFGTALGLDNYTIKKSLPRLIIATVLVQFSYLFVGILVDITNVLGTGIGSLLATAGGVPPDPSKGESFYFGAALTGLVGLAGAGGIVAFELVVPVLLILGSALVGLLTVFLTLQLRTLLILILVFIAPVAFLAWVLPNTEKWFKKWLSLLGGLLMMYPIIALLFAGAAVISNTVGSIDQGPGESGLVWQKLAASLAPIIVFFMVPATFKAGSSLLTRANGVMGKYGKSGYGKVSSPFAKRAQEKRAENGLEAANRLRQANAANPPSGVFGKAKSNIMGARASQMAGFGFSNSESSQRKVASASDKMIASKAELANRIQTDEEFGVKSQADDIADRQSILRDKTLDTKVGQESQLLKHNIGGVNYKMSDIPLNDAGKNYLSEIITDPTSKNTAQKIAAMQSLARSSPGRDKLAEIRTSSMGGTTTQLVSPDNAELWRKGTSTINKAGSPDLFKPTASAFSEVSGNELAQMSAGTASRAVSHWNSLAAQNAAFDRVSQNGTALSAAESKTYNDNKVTLSQANGAIQGLTQSPSLLGNVEPGTIKTILQNGSGSNGYVTENTREQLLEKFNDDGSRRSAKVQSSTAPSGTIDVGTPPVVQPTQTRTTVIPGTSLVAPSSTPDAYQSTSTPTPTSGVPAGTWRQANPGGSTASDQIIIPAGNVPERSSSTTFIPNPTVTRPASTDSRVNPTANPVPGSTTNPPQSSSTNQSPGRNELQDRKGSEQERSTKVTDRRSGSFTRPPGGRPNPAPSMRFTDVYSNEAGMPKPGDERSRS